MLLFYDLSSEREFAISFCLLVRKRFAASFVLLATVSVFFGMAQRASADDQTTEQMQTATVEHAPNMVHNFQRVSSGIWRGSAPSDAALDALALDGVKTIVDLRMDGTGVDSEKNAAQKLGMHYYHFALGFNEPSADKVQDILSIMTDPVNQPVFIHCRQGADRTGMLCGIYRRVWEGWSFRRTYHEMREHHFKPFLLTMRRQVEDADLNQAVIAVRAKHPSLIAAVPAAASPASSSDHRAPALIPEQRQPSGKNLLVVESHRNLN
jgi:protein tyrosine phosphatase (PTP) superfamily phosphohydrolase (DUF442 family)